MHGMRWLARFVILAFWFIAAGSVVRAEVPAICVLPGNNPSFERLVEADISRIFYMMTGEKAAVVRLSDLSYNPVLHQPAIMIGALQDDSMIRQVLGNDTEAIRALDETGEGGYIIRARNLDLFILSKSPEGAVSGLTAFFEACGCGFYPGGDFIPVRSLLPWPLKKADGKPKFRLRGLLPWYNFWDSPTAWNEDGWRSYIDAMSRQGLNIIALHSYDYEPFAGYRYKGRWEACSPLLCSASANWGCKPMPTGNFGFGTNRLFYQKYFGSDLAAAGVKNEQAIQREQELLADMLAYARARGIRTCVGFEVSKDPTDPGELERLESRILQVLQRYPLDYVWIWEPESWADGESFRPNKRSILNSYIRRWHNDLAYLGSEGRIAEAVRMALYAAAARKIIKAVQPEARLAVAGWGGDQWLHFTDFFPGMDKLLPKDIVFSALDNISITPNVSRNYAGIRDREMLPVPWFENDGDQWVPQPNTEKWLRASSDALEKGCAGILGIHWRFRDVEESAARMSCFARSGDRAAEDFYLNLSRHWFGDKMADEGAGCLMDLQKLGYRWTGGGGQSECAPLVWGPGMDDRKLADLKNCRERLAGLLSRAEKGEGNPASGERIRWLVATADWAADYELTARSMRAGGEAERLMSAAVSAGEAEKKELAEQALKALESLPLGKGMAAFASKISSRADLGTLASINCKAWWEIKKAMSKMAGLAQCPVPEEPDLVNDLAPAVLAPERPTTALAGRDLRIRFILPGSDRGIFLWRNWSGKWKSAEMSRLKNDVYEAVIPADELHSPGIEWYAESDSGPAATGRFPERGSWVTSVVDEDIRDVPRELRFPDYFPKKPKGLKARVLDRGAVELTWQPGKETGVSYLVSRVFEGESRDLGIAYDAWYEDGNLPGPEGQCAYTVCPRLPGGRTGDAAAVNVRFKYSLPAPPAGWSAEPGPSRVQVVLAPSADTAVYGWRIYTRRAGESGWKMAQEARSSIPGRERRISLPVPAGGRIEIAVSALKIFGAAGLEGERSAPVFAEALNEPEKPAVMITGSIDEDKAAGLKVTGNCRYIEDTPGYSVEFSGGWLEMPFPHDRFLNVSELTVAAWVLPKNTGGRMPLIVDYGTWQQTGFFLQIFNGQFRFHKAPYTTVDGGNVTENRWQHVAGVWDGEEARLYVNGRLVSERQSDTLFLSGNNSFFAGRYVADDPVYYYYGRIKDLRLYTRAFGENEIKLLMKK